MNNNEEDDEMLRVSCSSAAVSWSAPLQFLSISQCSSSSSSSSSLPLDEDEDDFAQLLLASTPCSDDLDQLLDFLLSDEDRPYPHEAPFCAAAAVDAMGGGDEMRGFGGGTISSGRVCGDGDDDEGVVEVVVDQVAATDVEMEAREKPGGGGGEVAVEEWVIDVEEEEEEREVSSSGGGGGGRKRKERWCWRWSEVDDDDDEEEEEEGASTPANKKKVAAVVWRKKAKEEEAAAAAAAAKLAAARWPGVHVAKRLGSDAEARYQRKASSEEEALNDGYRWRKYGQKKIKGHSFPRGYYKCCTNNCDVKKQVEKCDEDGQFLVTYEGIHLHYKPFNLNLNLHKQPNHQECKIATALLNMPPLRSSSCSTSTIARTLSPVIVNNDTTQLSKLVSL